MDDTYTHAFEWLIKQLAITSPNDLERAAHTINSVQLRYMNHYRKEPLNEVQVIEKEIFQAECLAIYYEGKLGLNQLAIYQQDVIRKLMKLRMLELK